MRPLALKNWWFWQKLATFWISLQFKKRCFVTSLDLGPLYIELWFSVPLPYKYCNQYKLTQSQQVWIISLWWQEIVVGKYFTSFQESPGKKINLADIIWQSKISKPLYKADRQKENLLIVAELSLCPTRKFKIYWTN